ncbi:GntR family transcriptional regulator [Marinomonas piezotolerans]|uniref:GntR family transcriptional regulator n=2 Tax=Marinomonas piezotolerans TaxID=2213058 RepID=A0A370UAL1_9GAMM|nr:GntR family transcriptional regulator [Marinomonas piezotolerans]
MQNTATKTNDSPLLRKTAYERIEALLNTGTLTPGQVVSQRELVELTDSTLGSIREAVSRLEAEGLLQTLPKRGLMVPSLDITFVRNAYELRKLIEVGTLERSSDMIPKSIIENWIKQHEKLLEQIIDNKDEEVSEEIQKLDWDMHSRIVNAGNNTLVENVYRITAIKIRMAVQSRIKVTPFNGHRVINEHLSFLRPLAAGDKKLAAIKLEEHLNNSLTLALGGTI